MANAKESTRDEAKKKAASKYLKQANSIPAPQQEEVIEKAAESTEIEKETKTEPIESAAVAPEVPTTNLYMVEREEPKTRRFPLLMQPTLYEQMSKIAKKSGNSVNEQISIALKLFVEKNL